MLFVAVSLQSSSVVKAFGIKVGIEAESVIYSLGWLHSEAFQRLSLPKTHEIGHEPQCMYARVLV
jgi:hypothetical protein